MNMDEKDLAVALGPEGQSLQREMIARLAVRCRLHTLEMKRIRGASLSTREQSDMERLHRWWYNQSPADHAHFERFVDQLLYHMEVK